MIGKDSRVCALPCYGIQRESLVDLVINKASLSRIQSLYEDVTVDGSAVQAFVFSPCLGRHLWIKAAPILDSQDRVVGGVQMIRDVTEDKRRETHLRESEVKLRHWREHDPLTRLHNRYRFEQDMCRIDSLQNEQVGALSFDVDGLRLVNERLGYAAGDRLLSALGQIVGRLCPSGAFAARLSGDKFAILWPNSAEHQIRQLAERLSQEFELHTLINPHVSLTLSVGWAHSCGERIAASQLLKAADADMYQEKLHSAISARSTI